MAKTLKDCTWTVYINKRSVGYPNFYWEARSEETNIELERAGSQYGSIKSAKENWKLFAKAEGIKNYTYLI